MSPLFLIAALLTADPQPEKIESIQFVGTPEYTAKVQSFKFDFQEARMAAFLRGPKQANRTYCLHYAIVNDCYLFVRREKFVLELDGVAVHGGTGEVRKVAFQQPSTNRATSTWDSDAARCFGYRSLLLGDAFQEDPFEGSASPNLRADVIQTSLRASDLTNAPLSSLKSAVIEGPPAVRMNACDELIDRGADGVSVMTELLGNDNRIARLCALHCLERVDVDIRSAAPAIVGAIRHTANEEFPICERRFGKVIARSANAIGLILQAVAVDPEAPMKERAYAMELLAWTEDPKYVPFVLGIATREDSDPRLASAAVEALNHLKAIDQLIEVIRGKNKSARIWSCFCLARGNYPTAPAAKVLNETLEDYDVEVRNAAKAALHSL